MRNLPPAISAYLSYIFILEFGPTSGEKTQVPLRSNLRRKNQGASMHTSGAGIHLTPIPQGLPNHTPVHWAYESSQENVHRHKGKVLLTMLFKDP